MQILAQRNVDIRLFSLHKLLVVVILNRRSHDGSRKEVDISNILHKCDILDPEIFLLLCQMFLVSSSVFNVVCEERVLADEDHHQSNRIHGPSSIVPYNLVQVVSTQVYHGLKSDEFSAFGSFGSDDGPYNYVLEEDGVD